MALPANSRIAAAFDELADLYELDGAIVHRVVAYRNAAKSVREASVSVAEMAVAGRSTELPGIGKTLEEKIIAMVDTGTIPSLEKLRGKFPPGLVAITRLPGLGAKKARRLFDELGIDSVETLREAAEQGRIRDLRGFGGRTEEAILAALAAGHGDAPAPRMLLSHALRIGEPLLEALRAHPAADRVEMAGSARRWTDTVKDLDFIATASDPAALTAALTALPEVESAQQPGPNAARGITHSGMSVDLRVVEPGQFGNLLQHFTGSRDHNMALRDAAVRRGLHVSEYGVLDDADGKSHRCATEEEVYALLGLAFIEPELREDRGELAAAANGSLPELVRREQIRGDLHMHTVASDGRNTVQEMVAAARELGYEYIAITDHSASHGFGNHVTAGELERQIERIHALDAQLDGFTLLAGSEVNVLPDGSLDYPDELLARLDWVVASLHTAFSMPREALTDRVVAAIEHPHVDVIGHLTGRKIGARPGYELDLERVFRAAARAGTFIEINSAADRRDLSDVHARAAAAAGVGIVIDSDAHGANTMGVLRYGVANARRAWLTAEQVVNTRPWVEVARMRKRGPGRFG